MKNILQPFLIKTKIFLNAKKGPISPQIWPHILFFGLDLKILNWNWEYFIKMLRLQILWYVRSALVITNVQLIPKHESWNERSFFINLYQNWMNFECTIATIAGSLTPIHRFSLLNLKVKIYINTGWPQYWESPFYTPKHWKLGFYPKMN